MNWSSSISIADFQSYLQAAVIALKPTYNLFKLTPCTLGYCEFVQCVRRTNAAILVRKFAPFAWVEYIFHKFQLLVQSGECMFRGQHGESWFYPNPGSIEFLFQHDGMYFGKDSMWDPTPNHWSTATAIDPSPTHWLDKWRWNSWLL